MDGWADKNVWMDGKHVNENYESKLSSGVIVKSQQKKKKENIITGGKSRNKLGESCKQYSPDDAKMSATTRKISVYRRLHLSCMTFRKLKSLWLLCFLSYFLYATQANIYAHKNVRVILTANVRRKRQ